VFDDDARVRRFARLLSPGREPLPTASASEATPSATWHREALDVARDEIEAGLFDVARRRLESLLPALTGDAHRVERFETWLDLGACHFGLARQADVPTEGLRQAILAFRRAAACHVSAVPVERLATLLVNLGVAHRAMSDVRDRTANLREARRAVQRALALPGLRGARVLERARVTHANILGSLALATRDRSRRARILREALAAIDSIPPDRLTDSHRMNRALLRTRLAAVDTPIPNLRRASQELRRVRARRSPTVDLTHYVNVTNNLANVHLHLAAHERPVAHLRRAVRLQAESLALLHGKSPPQLRALVEHGLGAAHAVLARYEARGANARRARRLLERALAVRSPGSQPLEAAKTLVALGEAHLCLAGGSGRKTELERARRCFTTALSLLHPDVDAANLATASIDLARTLLLLWTVTADRALVVEARRHLRRARPYLSVDWRVRQRHAECLQLHRHVAATPHRPREGCRRPLGGGNP
jgi:tetratricopeptide (TPR) repeat protein